MTKFWEDDVPGLLSKDFGITVTFSSSSVTKDVTAIFDNEYLAEQLVEGEVSSLEPQAHIATADIPEAQAGDTLKVEGTTYNITNVEPDGTGLTRVVLSKDTP